jgi:hypothetical protein
MRDDIEIDVALLKKDVESIRGNLQDIKDIIKRLEEKNISDSKETLGLRTKAALAAYGGLAAVLGWIAIKIVEQRGGL